jgi:antitoxin (DNA-binding transcriptional repressor) of toxin-antitoxin stability system
VAPDVRQRAALRRLTSIAGAIARVTGAVAVVTITGYDLVMKGIRIADLKSRLSEHLRTVRSGRSLTILDRDTPIARIVPWGREDPLELRKPRPGAPKPSKVRLPAALAHRRDIVDYLLEERQERS